MIAGVMVIVVTAIPLVPASVALITPMAAAVIDYRRRRIIPGRFIDDRRGRCPPTKRVDANHDVYVGAGGVTCGQRKGDHANRQNSIFHDGSSMSRHATGIVAAGRRDTLGVIRGLLGYYCGALPP
jgi:hypothetical protein